MRDPERIDAFLERLRKIWMRNPDLRFGQLVLNVSENISLLYNIEDDKFMTEMEKRYAVQTVSPSRPIFSKNTDTEFTEMVSNICNLMDDEEFVVYIEKLPPYLKLAYLEERFKSYVFRKGLKNSKRTKD